MKKQALGFLVSLAISSIAFTHAASLWEYARPMPSNGGTCNGIAFTVPNISGKTVGIDFDFTDSPATLSLLSGICTGNIVGSAGLDLDGCSTGHEGNTYCINASRIGAQDNLSSTSSDPAYYGNVHCLTASDTNGGDHSVSHSINCTNTTTCSYNGSQLGSTFTLISAPIDC